MINSLGTLRWQNKIPTFIRDVEKKANPSVATTKTAKLIITTLSLPILSDTTPNGYDTAVKIH
jgi:hypothetical protein